MSKHDHCCTDTAVSTCSNFIVERTGKLYILHCKIRFRTILPLCTTSGFAGLLRYFYEHTVTVLISQLISCLTCTYQYRRGVSFMISLQHADQKNTDGNSQLATTLHTLRTYLCIKPGKISTKREHEKYNTSTTIRTTKSSFLRTCVQFSQAADKMQGTRRRRCCVLRLSVPIN